MRLPWIIGNFPLGEIVVTPEADSKVPLEEQIACLLRHASGDWGDLDEQDWKQNEAALEHGGRLFSRYRTRQGTTFYIITEHHRLLTTILLPGDY